MDRSQRGSQAPRIVLEHYLDEVFKGRSGAAIDELIVGQDAAAAGGGVPISVPDVVVERGLLDQLRLTGAHGTLECVQARRELERKERRKRCSTRS